MSDEIDEDAAHLTALLVDADPSTFSPSEWRALAAVSAALAAVNKSTARQRELAKFAPSDHPELKILWPKATRSKNKPKAAASGSSRKATKMRDGVVRDFVDRIRRSAPVDEERMAILGDLQSKEIGLTKDEMVEIAKGALGAKRATKKAALDAIANWFWHRVRGANDAKHMTRAGAR